MILEQQINQILDHYNENSAFDGDSHLYMLIEHWQFKSGADFDEIERDLRLDGILRQVTILIELAQLEECLTSPSQFVREYKKWSMTSDRQINLS